jgi:hypothetical protein
MFQNSKEFENEQTFNLVTQCLRTSEGRHALAISCH